MLFEQAYCKGEIVEQSDSSDLKVRVHITDIVDNGIVRYLAAATPDYHYSYSGSALPFANPTQAFQDTPNKGVIQLQGNTMLLELQYPNSYYIGLGTVLIPPSLSLFYISGGEEKTIVVKIAEEVPFRLLTKPRSLTYSRESCMFYIGTDNLPIRTQEQILRSASYPTKNKTPENFWGLKPRC